MSWAVTLDFQDGNGARDITSLVLLKSLEKKTQLHNGLKPVIDTCSFRIGYDSVIINLLLTADKDVFVSIQKNTDDYFTGIVRLNFSGNIRYSKVEPFKIECVDMGEYYLKKKISTIASLANYKVSDTANTSSSIVHYLLGEAGMNAGNILPDDIDVAIDYFVITDSDTYWTKIEKLLFEMGYVFYFDASGNFKTKDLFPVNTTPAANLDSSLNMLGTLVIQKKPEQFEGISVRWWEHETIQNTIAFNDTTGGDETNPCNITIAPGGYYPAGASDHPVYSNYKVDDREIVVVLNPDFSSGIIMESGLEVINAINYFKKARLEVRNNDSVDRKITSFQILGDAVVKGDLNITKVINVTGSTKIKEISTEYITDSAGALRLSSGLGLFYRYSDFQYTCKSKDSFNPGDILRILDSVSGIDVICRVVVRKENSVKEEIFYILEGVSEYAAQVTEDSAEHVQPAPLPPGSGAGLTEGLPTYQNLDEGYTSTSGGTTTPTVPTLLADSAYKSIILKVDKQTNLRYLKEYQFQVSDDGSNWYALRFDGVDWKGALGATTSWPTEQLVHSRIPSDLTDPDNPQPRSLFYRSRRVTVQNVASDWSATVTGITSLVESGDIPANTITANMVTTTFLETAFLDISGHIVIGYTGTGTPSIPNEGDKRLYIDGTKFAFEEYTGGEWSSVNAIKIGGADSNGLFAPFIQCRGVVNPLAEEESQEFIPVPASVFNFENNYTDQNNSSNGWSGTDVKFVSTPHKFGGYSIVADGVSRGSFAKNVQTYSKYQSFSVGAWVYFSGSVDACTIISFLYDGSSNYAHLDLKGDGRLVLELSNGSAVSYAFFGGAYFDLWNYISLSAEQFGSMILFKATVNNVKSSLSFDMPNATNYSFLSVYANDTGIVKNYIDEVIYTTEIIEPDVYLQHYNHEVPWNTKATAKDIILKPASGGKVVIDGDLKLPQPNSGFSFDLLGNPYASITIPANTSGWVRLVNAEWRCGFKVYIEAYGNSTSTLIKMEVLNGMTDKGPFFEVAGNAYNNKLTTFRVHYGPGWSDDTDLWVYAGSHGANYDIKIIPMASIQGVHFIGAKMMTMPSGGSNKDYNFTGNGRIYFNS